MRKQINVKEPLELELVFNNKNVLLVFNNKAFMNLTQSQEELMDFVSNINIPEICAKIIQASAVPELSIDEAREITVNLDNETIMEIVNDFNESTGIQKNEVTKELQKKLMMQFLNKMR